MQQESQIPVVEEPRSASTKAFKGIEVGLGQDDPLSAIAAELESQYPGYLVVVQAGTFLHAFDRSAHALATLKGYKLKLVGTAKEQHLRVGFPVANFKSRLWPFVEQYKTPYVAAIGGKVNGYVLVTPDGVDASNSIMDGIDADIVSQHIADLQQRGEVNQASARKLLANPDTAGFRLKALAIELDTILTLDIVKMARDLRVVYGENVRACMARIMESVFAFGLAGGKVDILHAISADIDLLKHYIAQGQKLPKLKVSFEHRTTMAVELGRLVGGLLKAQKAAA